MEEKKAYVSAPWPPRLWPMYTTLFGSTPRESFSFFSFFSSFSFVVLVVVVGSV